jgi:hypothetical protein
MGWNRFGWTPARRLGVSFTGQFYIAVETAQLQTIVDIIAFTAAKRNTVESPIVAHIPRQENEVFADGMHGNIWLAATG